MKQVLSFFALTIAIVVTAIFAIYLYAEPIKVTYNGVIVVHCIFVFGMSLATGLLFLLKHLESKQPNNKMSRF